MDLNRYLVQEKQNVKLEHYATSCDQTLDKEEIKSKLMPQNIEAMAILQERLYAENRQGLLLVFQAMDAAGKDGVIKHVMTGLNPQGTQVTAFKVPSSEEMDHDYLWRTVKALPRRGEIGIFNRSHYEDVIVTRVHDLVRTSQLPLSLMGDGIWEQRYEQIRNFEKYLAQNGFYVLKFFLYVSKQEQRQRLLDRINEPDKNWKFSPGDVEERKHWDQYMQAYEHMLENTSTQEAPWYVVPADNKWCTRYLVSEIITQKLNQLNPQYPELAPADRAALEECRKLLEQDA